MGKVGENRRVDSGVQRTPAYWDALFIPLLEETTKKYMKLLITLGCHNNPEQAHSVAERLAQVSSNLCYEYAVAHLISDLCEEAGKEQSKHIEPQEIRFMTKWWLYAYAVNDPYERYRFLTIFELPRPADVPRRRKTTTRHSPKPYP